MHNLSIILEIHTKSLDFILAYNQADEKTEICMELPIGLGVEGYKPRECLITLDKNYMA